jgi:arylsulfatase A-like enzyme
MLTRREWVGSMLAVAAGRLTSQDPLSRPNVVVLAAGRMRAECLGAAGNAEIHTPHLDALVADGVFFRNAFCTWPGTTPSRYSLLSGQYVRQHRGRSNRSTMLPGTPTFASLLREAGYRTRAVGKMGFNPPRLDVGFEQMEIIEEESAKAVVETGDRAAAAISHWNNQPQLLLVGFANADPGAPFDAAYDPQRVPLLPGWTERLTDQDVRYRPGLFDESTYRGLTAPEMRRNLAREYGSVSQMDAQAGRIVEALKRKNLYESTLIIFVADCGDYLGFHHLYRTNNYMYDAVMRVPAIVKMPGQFYAGASTDAQVTMPDVTSTILTMAGLPKPPDMRGQNLILVLSGRRLGHLYVFAEDPWFLMARSNSRKMLYTGDSGRSLFFDLEKDPLEMRNAVNDPGFQGDMLRMEDALLSWLHLETQAEPYVDPNAKQVKE